MTQKEYDELIAIAKNIDPINYMDVAHDHILTGKSMKELKFQYLDEKIADFSEIEDTAKVCCRCNTILSINEFKLVTNKGRTYVMNVCIHCRGKHYNNYQRQRRKTDESFRISRNLASAKWRKENPEQFRKSNNIRNNKESYDAYRRKWREENKERINKEQREWYERNKEVKREERNRKQNERNRKIRESKKAES